MGLNIKNPEVEQLVAEVAEMSSETKTQAIRQALEERRARLVAERVGGSREQRLRRFLEQEMWPKVPPDARGRPLSRAEEEAILGYGPEGV